MSPRDLARNLGVDCEAVRELREQVLVGKHKPRSKMLENADEVRRTPSAPVIPMVLQALTELESVRIAFS
jgi:hypothetical protein